MTPNDIGVLRYGLLVLTHGDNTACLSRTVESFYERIDVLPAVRMVVQDGPCALPPIDSRGEWHCATLPAGQGFCRAVRFAWSVAGCWEDIDYWFWLEHDFTFRRSIPVGLMAAILADDLSVAQVSLMRDAVSPREQRAGGVVADHRGRGSMFMPQGGWLRHGAYFTTNPSLMRREFMGSNPWPGEDSECEGRMGGELRDAGFDYAIMGDGEPWCDHIGVRNGSGY